MTFTVLCLLAQITNPPEFKTGSVFQKDRTAATVDGTSHASAEKAEINATVLASLKLLPSHQPGAKFIESRNLPAAEAWFRQRNLPIGIALTQFFAGKETEAVQALITLARSSSTPLSVVPFLAETATTVPSLVPAAYQLVESLCQKHPDNAAALYHQARLMQHLPDADASKAIPLLEKSIQLSPSSTLVLLELSRIQSNLGDRPSAIASLEKALAVDNELSVAHYRIASLYRVTGQPEKARLHMTEFQKLQSKGK